MRYATQRLALAICDRCGRTCRLETLTNQIINRKKSGIHVCTGCLDIDQEQLQLGTLRVDDAIALKDPRPDTNPGRSDGTIDRWGPALEAFWGSSDPSYWGPVASGGLPFLNSP